MLDDLIYDTFDLDYQIYSWINSKFKEHAREIENPKLKSEDIFKEFSNYVNVSKKIFYELNRLLQECNEQRQHLRTIIIKMSKDKMLIQKLFKEEDNNFVLSRLQIQEELKSVINHKNLETIVYMNKTISNLQNQLGIRKIEMIPNSSNTTLHSHFNKSNGYQNSKSNSNLTKREKEKEKSSFAIKSVAHAENHKSSVKSFNKKPNFYTKSLNNEKKNTKITSSKNSLISNNLNKVNKKIKSDTSKKDLKNFDIPTEILSGNMLNLNLDFNTEKYNIISSSPIMTPKENKAKNNVMYNFKKLLGKYTKREDIYSARGKSSKISSDHQSQGKHMRHISYQIDPHHSNNLLSTEPFKKIVKKAEKVKVDLATEQILKIEKNKINDLRNIDTITNFSNFNTSSYINNNYNETNSENNNQTQNLNIASNKTKTLGNISKSIDFESVYLNDNLSLLQSKLNLTNEINSEDRTDRVDRIDQGEYFRPPKRNSIKSLKTSANPSPKPKIRHDFSLISTDPKFLLNEDNRIETDFYKDEKIPQSDNIIIKKKKKRNSMSEIIFSNFTNKYNIDPREDIIKEERNTKKSMEIGKRGKIKNTTWMWMPVFKKNSFNNKVGQTDMSNKKITGKRVVNISYKDSFYSHRNTFGYSNASYTNSVSKNKNLMKSFNSVKET